jgi:hypothetical protein
VSHFLCLDADYDSPACESQCSECRRRAWEEQHGKPPADDWRKDPKAINGHWNEGEGDD